MNFNPNMNKTDKKMKHKAGFEEIKFRGGYVVDGVGKTEIVEYDHIYRGGGFKISGRYTQDGKDYAPKSQHACLRYSHWCWSNALQNPKMAFNYLIKNILNL